jgi:rare lipoprotein A (peptidoglycan hydrolase)
MVSTLRRTISRALVPAALASLVAAGAIRPATAADLDALRARAQRAADEVTELEHRLASLRTRQARLEASIDVASRRIGVLEVNRQETDAAYRTARAEFVTRAVAAYKEGTVSKLDVLLSAHSLADLVVLEKASGRSAELASESLDVLLAARTDAEAAQDALEQRKARLLAAKAEVDEVTSEMAATVAERRRVAARLAAEVEALEAEARRQARIAARAAAEEAADPLGDVLARGPNGRPSSGIPAGFIGTGVTFEGIASWYGPGFEGNPTANGDIFDPDKFTAASRDLPLGTWLYVEHGGKGVVVYVNDRGPYIEERILDLSQAAAEAIGIGGLGWVKCEVVIKK